MRTNTFDLGPDEHVACVVRKHWLLFIADLIPYAILLILPFALPGLLHLTNVTAPFVIKINYGQPLMRVLLGVWLLLAWTGAWSSFTLYFLNAWILTNRRIIDIKQRSYFNREVSSVLLERVQDVTTDISGVLSSLVEIGTISVQSAGTVDEFKMLGIPHPDQMRDLILKYVPEEVPGSAGV